MKHAYLIMAHTNPRQLGMLLQLLDEPNNDIYLHIDVKSQDIDIDALKKNVNKAGLQVFQLFDNRWAEMSITKCQLHLLSEAVKTYHDYYHLISGQDLPIKSNREINDFFTQNKGFEFIHFDPKTQKPKESSKFYHFGKGNFEIICVRIQRKIGFDRHIPTGSEWFSITHELALDLSQHKQKALKAVKFTISSDECVLQNFVDNITKNEYKLYQKNDDDNYVSNMRLIDWKRGNGRNPYTWRIEDFDEIMRSDRLFARKFDEKVDFEIIDQIVKKIRNENIRNGEQL